jgi:hypothetical protein
MSIGVEFLFCLGGQKIFFSDNDLPPPGSSSPKAPPPILYAYDIEYKVEINFNTVTEDASDDSKISSLVSGLVWIS